MSEEKIPNFIPMRVDKSPLIDDVFGKARTFIDDLETNVKGKNVFEVLGIQPNKTFLLEGEKGTGKTMSIKAYNNSKNKGIYDHIDENGKVDTCQYSVLSFAYDTGKYGTAYINMSSRVIDAFFSQAGIYAQLGKSVLIQIDEADSLLASRTNNIQAHSEDRKALETLMKNLQIAHDTPNMYVALITNLPEGCDDAALRSGRIDKRYKFVLPTEEERKIAFQKTIQKVNSRANYQLIRGQRYDPLVELSEGFNYSDIVYSVERSVRTKAEDLVQSECKKLSSAPRVGRSLLEEAVKSHKREFINKKTSKKIGYDTRKMSQV